jgi:hypothetical protein
MAKTTARNSLRIPDAADTPDVPRDIDNLGNDVDVKMVSWWEGTHAGRPAAGQQNRLYKETDTGVIYHDTGSVWEPVVTGVPGASQSTVSWGVVENVVGGIKLLASSGDFTVARLSSSEVEVKWTKAKSSANYAVVATVLAASSVYANVVTSASRFIIYTTFTESTIAFVVFAGS